MEVKELFSRLKKEAECSICIDTVNQPKTLPCLHSFCLECINNFAATKRRQGNTTFGCPACSAIVNIPDGDRFDNFPTSLYLNRLVDILPLEDQTAEQHTCNNCDENAPAASFCFECKDFLCSVCLAAHNRMKTSRAHRQVSLKNLTSGDVEELIQRPVMCEKPHHKEVEPREYYCQDCQECICLRCCVIAHNQHAKLGIGEAADQHKAEIIQSIQKIRDRVAESKQEMEKENERFEIFQQQVKSSRDKVQRALSELYQILKKYETSFMKHLDDLFTTQQKAHAAKQKNFELSLAQMNSSVDYMEAIVQRNIGAEILQSRTAIPQRSEEILQRYKITSSKIPGVSFLRNVELCEILRQSAPGRFFRSFADPSSSAEGKGLHEAECGETAEFTIITKDAEGETCYSEEDRVSVRIQTAGGEVETEVKSKRDGRYHVTYTPMKHGEGHVMIQVNGHVLRDSPWNVHVTPHQYQAISSFDSKRGGKGEADFPWGLAVSNTGNVAIADSLKKTVKVFNSDGRYLNEFSGGGRGAGEKLTSPMSVAYTNDDHILVADDFSKVLLFKKSGQFLKRFNPALIKSPRSVAVTRDGHVIICEGDSNKVLVLSADGNTLLQSFKAPDCDTAPWRAVYHEDKFFVSYTYNHCIKTFDSAGNYIQDIGREGTGNGQFNSPVDVTIDKFNNLVVVDCNSKRLQIFTQQGEFLSVVGGIGAKFKPFDFPVDVVTSKDGRLYVTDHGKSCVHILH